MDTNKVELSMDELEMVNGGEWSLRRFIGGAVLGGGTGAVAGAAVALLLSGPVGWCIAGGVVVGAGAVGAVCGSGVTR